MKMTMVMMMVTLVVVVVMMMVVVVMMMMMVVVVVVMMMMVVVVTTTMLLIMTQIAEIDDVWEYMNNTVLGTLYAISNTTAANGAMLVLGSLRIHQIRQTSGNGTNPCCAYCSVGVSLCVCVCLAVCRFVWPFLPFCLVLSSF